MLKKYTEKTFIVSGMTCEGCKKRVTNSLLNMDSVNKVKVNLKNGEVKLYCDKDVDIESIKNVLKPIGYDVQEV